MAYVTSLTADRMLEIEQKSVTSGHIDAFGNLILRTHGGSEFNAGKATGGAGVGVSSVNHFYLQLPKGSSAPSAPVILDPPEDSPWKDVEPQYEPNTVVYITTRVVYSNGTFQYTRPSVSSNYAAVDSVAANVSEIYELADQAEARADSALEASRNAVSDAQQAKADAAEAISGTEILEAGFLEIQSQAAETEALLNGNISETNTLKEVVTGLSSAQEETDNAIAAVKVDLENIVSNEEALDLAVKKAQSDATAAATKANDAYSSAQASQKTATNAFAEARAIAESGGSMIVNGRFDILGEFNTPLNWDDPNSSNRFYPTGVSRSGTHCLRQVTGTNSYGTLNKVYSTMSKGRSYYLEVWVKAEATVDLQRVGMYVRGMDKSLAAVQNMYATSAATTLSTTEWTKVSGIVTPTVDGIVFGQVGTYTSSGTGGSYLFDDALMYDVTDAIAAQNQANSALSKAVEAKEAADNAAAAVLTAQATADAASQKASTADGRYTVAAREPLPADGAGKPTNAVWEVRSGTSAIKRYIWSGSKWEQIYAGQDFIGPKAIGRAQIGDAAIGTAQIADLSVTNGKLGSVSIGKLEVLNGAKFNAAVMNSLITDQAFINRLLAERAIISGAENRIPNGDLGLGTTVPWKDVTLDATDKPAPYKYSMAGPRSSTASQFFNGDDSWIDVTPGGVYRFECWARADLPNSAFYLELRDQDGNHAIAKGEALGDNSVRATTGTYLMNQTNLPTQWTRYGALVTLRDTSTRVRIGAAYWNHPVGTEKAAIQKLAGMSLRPMVGSDLIVNGSVMIGSLAPEVMDTVESSISEVQQSTSEYIDSTHQEALAGIDSVSGAIQALANEVTERNLNYDLYIQLDGSGILLGQRDSPFKVKITNTEMSFLQDGLTIAYVSNSKLYITDVEVKNNLAMGTPDSGFFDFIPRANGNLSFVYRRN